jgi:hypothetical protein
VSDDKGGLPEKIVGIATTLAPKVPPSAAPAVVVFAVGVAAILAAAAFAGTVVIVSFVVVTVVALVGAILTGLAAGDGGAAKPGPGNTIALSDELANDQRDAVCQIVQSAVADVADVLGTDKKRLRGNVFGCDGKGGLRIMPEYSHNMNTVEERSIAMPIGQGSNGHAWQTGRPNIAIRQGDWDDTNALPANMAKRVHPDLTWVISAPVYSPEQQPPPTWVLNVDGLRDTRTKDELSLAVGKVMLWADQLGRVISQGAAQ